MPKQVGIMRRCFYRTWIWMQKIWTRMWADVQRDRRPAEYRWRPLFNAAKFGWRPLHAGVPCSNAAKTRKPLKLAGVPQTTGPISPASGSKFTILLGHVKQILLLNNFFPIVDTCLSCEYIARLSCAMVPRWRIFWKVVASCIFSDPHAASFRPASQIRTKATPCVEV